jgi:hypothetical protein
MKVIMVKVIDSLMYSSSLSRLGPLMAKKTKTNGKFKVSEESDPQMDDTTDIAEVQSKPFIKSLSLLKLNHLSESHELEIVSYGEDLLSQLQDLQCHLLMGDISYEDLEVLDNTFQRLPESLPAMSKDLQDIVNNIQVRVAVELAKFHRTSTK